MTGIFLAFCDLITDRWKRKGFDKVYVFFILHNLFIL